MRTSTASSTASQTVDHRFPRDVLRSRRRRAEGRRQRRDRAEGRAQVIRAALATLGVLLRARRLLVARPSRNPEPPASRLELGVGVRWIGARAAGGEAGDGNDRHRRHVARCSARRASWRAPPASRAASAFACPARSTVEAEASYVKPELRIAVSGDAESAAPVTATETIQQFTIGGDLVWYLPVHRWSPTPRAVRDRRRRIPAAAPRAGNARRDRAASITSAAA